MEPQSVTYLSNRAAAYMSAYRYQEALEDSQAAASIEPQNAKVLNRLARICTSIGRPTEALQVLDRIAAFVPVTPQDRAPALSMHTHIKQAEDAVREGTTGSMAIHALDQAERGLGVRVDRPRKWLLLRGEAYLKMGNINALGQAQDVAMTLLRKNNKDPEALVLRGRALYGQGDNAKALQHFKEALNCDPDFKDGVKYLRMVQKLDRLKEEGNAAYKSGRNKQAVEVYTQALEVDPGNKGTNSKILQNRALASIKVCTCFSSFLLFLPTTMYSKLYFVLIYIVIAQKLPVSARRLHPRISFRSFVRQSPENQSPSARRIRRLGGRRPRI